MPTEKKFKISAVVPLFNGEKFISEALESLLSQTHPIDEIIIIDDKSTDQGLKKVQKLAESNDTIKLLINSTNRGSSHCRNLGIKESSSHYIMFLDQDDYLSPNFNDVVIRYLIKNQHKKILGLHTSYFIIDEKREKTIEYSNEEIEPEEFLGYQFVRNRILSNSGTVIKKSILKQVGSFDEDLKFSQDWDLWLKIGQFGAFAYIKKPLTYIRRHSKNTSNKIDGFLKDENSILLKYDLDFIKTEIMRRKLPKYENKLAFVSILFRLSKFELMKEEIKRIEEKKNNNNDHYFYSGLLNYKLKNIKGAVDSFKKIPSHSRYFQSAQNNLSAMLIISNDHETAHSILYNLLTKRPDFQDAVHNFTLTDSRKEGQMKIKLSTRPLRNSLYIYS